MSIAYGFTCRVTDQKAPKLSQMISSNFAAIAWELQAEDSLCRPDENYFCITHMLRSRWSSRIQVFAHAAGTSLFCGPQSTATETLCHY